MRVLQDELLRELTRPELDPRLIETVRRKLAAESDWLSQHMTQALVNVYSVLTPVQREKVSKAMLDQAGASVSARKSCSSKASKAGRPCARVLESRFIPRPVPPPSCDDHDPIPALD